MSKKENQKQKLIRLIQILMRETDEDLGLSMQEIISHLGEYGINAERKSIYDDFLVLEELGFFIRKTATKPPKYILENRIFELPELKMLVDAVQASKFITAKKSREIIDKLSLFASSHRSRELSRQVYIEDRVKTISPIALYSIDSIHSAINDKRKLTFKYFDYNSEKERVLRHNGEPYSVSPLSLLWDDEKYYLVAYDESAMLIKNFRVDKMIDVREQDVSISENETIRRFNPSDYSKKIFGMYGGKEELVTLECKNELAGVIIDRFGTDPVLIKTDFGFKLSLRIMVSPTFFSWVLGFGKDLRIISPLNVREKFKSTLREITESYEL